MKPLEAAAKFAAFTWYTGNDESPPPVQQSEAIQFAQKNWQTFLPVAHAGWGRLLLRIAKARPHAQRKRRMITRTIKT
jgi:hypothetical protein